MKIGPLHWTIIYSGHWTSLSRQRFLLQWDLSASDKSGWGMETGQEAELEDAKKGKVKRLVPVETQNWQKIWIKHTKDQGEVKNKRFGWGDKISNGGLGEQKVRNEAGWPWERNTWPPRGSPRYSHRAQQVVCSLMTHRVWGPGEGKWGCRQRVSLLGHPQRLCLQV